MAVITKEEVHVGNVSNKIEKVSAEIGKILKKVYGFFYKILRNSFVFIFYRDSNTNIEIQNKSQRISEAEIRQYASNNLRFIR